MKFVCDRCQTRYSIADEKVRQKILRIRCKTCGNVIVVQDEQARSSGGEAGVHGADASEHFESAKTDATSSPKAVPSSAPKAPPSSAPKVAPSSSPRPAQSSAPKPVPSSSPRAASASAPKAVPTSAPKLPPSSGPKLAPAAVKAGPAGPPPPPPAAAVEHDPLGGRVEWYLAIGGVRSGPFSRVEAAQKVLTAEPGKIVHVWKEGMPGWKPSEEVSVIARELSILRPPPPPPPTEPVKAPSPKSSALPKVAAMPPAVAKAAKAQEQEPQSLFPGKPLNPMLGGVADPLDFAVDTNPGVFSDITTKKAKKFPDVGSEPAMGIFADVTTKKNRNLRELEVGSLFSSAPALSESDRTPPPVQPLAPMAAKAAEPAHASSSSASLAVSVRVSSTNLPVAVPPRPLKVAAVSPPSPFAAPVEPFAAGIASHATPAAATAPAGMDGFSEVIRAVAESEDPASSQPDFSVPLTPPGFSTFPSASSPELQSPRGLARPGLKYVVAACVIVALVILIVMVTLRMDSRKVPEPEPAPAQAVEPVAAEPSKPVAVELPKPTPVVEEKAAQGTRGAGKHGLGKPGRHVDVGPAPERQPPAPKQPAKPELVARPNPFNESKATVSQSQISAVVRSKANQAGLKACYERALKMDNHLTSGRIDVTVSVGTSGVVQRVVINAPSSFIMVEPCIKTAVKRWVFPPSSEEYGTNFPLIMQGGM